MLKCVAETEKLPGRTIVLVDAPATEGHRDGVWYKHIDK